MLCAAGADVTTPQAVLLHQSFQTTLRYYGAAHMDLARGVSVEAWRKIEAIEGD